MLFASIIIAYLGAVFCFAGAIQQGKRVLKKLPDSAENEPFAGRLSRVFSLSEEPEVRRMQQGLINWIAALILCLTIARYGQLFLENPPAS